jgi:hypothetical protein
MDRNFVDRTFLTDEQYPCNGKMSLTRKQLLRALSATGVAS